MGGFTGFLRKSRIHESPAATALQDMHWDRHMDLRQIHAALN